jgi:aminoglycoside phosphotransferase (APT) family kinase protein
VGKSETVSGVDVGNVTGWIQQRVPSLAPPLRFDLIAGGLSNLSYRVMDGNGTRWVLRRPPLGHVLATAHDMSREFKIIDALATTNVPVPPLVGLCTDDAVNGAPFYVMDFVDGVIARDRTSADSLSPEARRRSGESLVEVLAAIHAVDIDACGLGDLGRKEAYVERQISRWTRQWEATRDGDVPVMEELSTRLAAAIPEQGPATIVHGDYRLDNCILDSDGSVASVLDWELCTLGNPLADVGLMLVYWVESGDSIRAGLPDGTTAEGFATRAELLARYSEITGRDVGNIGYFIALGYWKLACILQGVMVRFRAGAMVSEAVGSGQTSADTPGSDASPSDMFTDQVVALGRAGLAALEGELGSSHG